MRTIERDVTRRRAAGIPIEVKRGTGGGYRLTTACSALDKLVTAFG